jgi:predicted dinucleotide-binding enzyme
MKIAVLGTGMVGRALAGRLDGLGHDVVVGTRDPEATLARTEPDAMGTPAYAAWAGEHSGVRLATFAEATADAALVVNASSGAATLEVLSAAGAEHLAGKPLLDIANPLDFSQGFPPSLFVKDTDSLAEQVQRAFPDARVVKALNTLNASLMVEPKRLGESSTVFVSGDDRAAKATVVELLESFGHDDVIDLGALETARGTEMLLPIWLRLMNVLGTAEFNLKVVRG